MPQNCVSVSTESVVNFFVEEIGGTGKYDGFPRNEYLAEILKRYKDWKLCELTEDEFMRLTIPDGEKLLLKDKIKKDFDSDLQIFVDEKLKLINSGKELPPLIVREMLNGENLTSSFYIEDGAHRAITLGVFFNDHSYKPVKAYAGSL